MDDSPDPFDAWLDAVFRHDEGDFAAFQGAIEAAYPWDLSDAMALAHVTRTFEGAGSLLAPYDDAQVGDGLWFLVSSTAGTLNALLDGSIPWPERERCVRSFVNVFREVFAARCAPVLSHTGQSGHSPLHLACYMWWDVFPFWGSTAGEPRLDDLFLEVMEATLRLDCDPCRESALHGLGHLPSRRGRVRKVIERFLEEAPGLRPELRAYACAAMSGCVQ